LYIDGKKTVFFENNFVVSQKNHIFATRKIYRKNKRLNSNMKSGIHPENYRPVAFRDISNNDTFISRSTVNTKENVDIDGVTYPLVKLEISSSSHPFYTGKSKLVDSAGRVDKFMNRYAKRMEANKK
jgi:large subunit ribosomal protein L31